MNVERHHLRLDELESLIARLETELVEREREAIDVLGTEEDCFLASGRAEQARTMLTRAMREYVILAAFVRRSQRHARAA